LVSFSHGRIFVGGAIANQMRLAGRLRIFWACCPSLPGCSVYGQTKEDAHSKIDLTVQGYLANLDLCLPQELSRAMELDMA
jgi:predicted RNase H-like HicB family nuclease